MNNKSFSRDLTEGPIALSLFAFMGPLFLSNLLQTMYNLVDMAVVGRFVGSAGLSALSVCGEIIHFLTFLSIGFSGAGQVLISQVMGSGQPERMEKLIGTLFTTLLVSAVVLSGLSWIFCEQILDFSNVPEVARIHAKWYYLTCACGFIFTFGYNAVGAILRGMGDSRHPFEFIAIATFINIALDLLFVAIFSLGTFGAALATVIAQAVSFTASVILIRKHRADFGFAFHAAIFVPEKESFVMLLSLGIPMALQSGLIQFSRLVVVRWINVYGVAVSAITGIGGKLYSISLTFGGAISTATAAMIGQCIGARKLDRIRSTLRVSSLMALCVAGLMCLTLVLLQRPVFGLFTPDEEVLALIGKYLPVVLLMLCSSSVRAPMLGLINGSGSYWMNFTVAILDGIAGHIGFSWLLGMVLGLGLPGLWYGNALAGFVPFLVGVAFYFSGAWKKEKKLAKA